LKRTKLADRFLPDYTRGEEIMNMVTHIVGGGIGIPALVLCVYIAALHRNTMGIIGSAIYGFSMIALYAVSSIYHGLHMCSGKKVMQIIDHCTIYFLIAGTYTPILLSAFVPRYPMIGWGLLLAQWLLVAVATTLTAIDLKRYRVFSMVCYIAMGWAIIFFIPQTIQIMTVQGFCLLLGGGIVYTIGAVLFGIGVKVRWMHSVFHIFVVIGSILQLLSIAFYAL
jgi:hemolysin III